MIKSTGHKLRPSFTPIYTKTSYQIILYNKMTAHKIDPNGSWFIDSLLLHTNRYLLVEMRRIEIMFLHPQMAVMDSDNIELRGDK